MPITESLALWAYTSLELAGVAVILIGVAGASLGFLRRLQSGVPAAERFHTFRRDVGRSILLGLEFLIAADLIRTVAVDPTLSNVAILGLIVLIRTFLGLTLDVEVEGKWPWQGEASGVGRQASGGE